jgi:hypothetical protein
MKNIAVIKDRALDAAPIFGIERADLSNTIDRALVSDPRALAELRFLHSCITDLARQTADVARQIWEALDEHRRVN